MVSLLVDGYGEGRSGFLNPCDRRHDILDVLGYACVSQISEVQLKI